MSQIVRLHLGKHPSSFRAKKTVFILWWWTIPQLVFLSISTCLFLSYAGPSAVEIFLLKQIFINIGEDYSLKLLLHSEGERKAWQQPIFFLMRGYSWLKLSVYQCSEMVCVTTASDVKGVSTWKYNPCARTQCLTFQAANSWKMLCKHFNKTILIPGYYYCSHLRFYAIHLSWVSWKQWAHVYVFVDRQWEAPTLLALLPFEVLLQGDIWIENPVFFLQRNLSFLKQVSTRVGEILVKLF